jgi:hypothetical protein
MDRFAPTVIANATAIRRMPSGALDHAAYERRARRLRRVALAHLADALATRMRAMLRARIHRRAQPCPAALPCR